MLRSKTRIENRGSHHVQKRYAPRPPRGNFARGLHQADGYERALSLALCVPYSRLREIVDGTRGISADTALRLERYFGSEAQGWLNLQAAYDLRVAEKLNAKAIHRDIAPLTLTA